MTDSSTQITTAGLHRLRVDRRLLASAEILGGTGAVLLMAGCVIGFAALRRAAQDWLEQLDQAPSDLVVGKWHQLLHAATVGTNAYRSGVPKGT
jgi:hypothetical protein